MVEKYLKTKNNNELTNQHALDIYWVYFNNFPFFSISFCSFVYPFIKEYILRELYVEPRELQKVNFCSVYIKTGATYVFERTEFLIKI